MRTNVAGRFPRAALSMLRRNRADGSAKLPETELTTTGVTVNGDRYADYCRVTGFRLSGNLPVTYPHLLGFPSAMRLFTDRSFPFSPVGMVHTRNRIVQHHAIDFGAELTVRVRLDNLAPHHKGVTFDVMTDVQHGDEPVWNETSTYLVRAKGSDAARVETRPPRVGTGDIEAVWSVRGDIGRRYAAVSGDYNPIHLHPITARAFGMRRPIAHGMWTLASCLGTLEGRTPEPPLIIDADFRRPLPLPSNKVALCTLRDGATWHFGLFETGSAKPYLSGSATPVGNA